MKAVKDNKVYTITEEQQKFYTDAGFDIVDDAGKVISYGRGKTVPYEKYAALKEALEAAKTSNDSKELEALKKENQQLKKQGENAFAALEKYCNEKGIDIGNTTTVTGLVKKLDESEKA